MNSKSDDTKKMQSVYDKLKEDHREVEKLFKKILDTSEKDVEEREALFQELHTNLTAHAQAEEKIFYPVTQGEESTRSLTLEAYEEHKIAYTLLEELSELDKVSEVWMAKVKVLSEVVKHHVEEEENELFPKAKKVIEKDQSKAMAEQIEHEEEVFKKAS
jgi:hemerythrin superfamily protein